jgi:hypothetical protein
MTNYLSPLSEAEPAVVFQRLRRARLAIPGALRINTVYRSLYLMPNANASGDLRILPVSVAGYGGASKSCIQIYCTSLMRYLSN